MSAAASHDHAPLDAPVQEGEAEGFRGEMLRAVMRRVASPVTVVTTVDGGEPRGATIGSFTSVSLDPPLVSFNVQKHSQLHAALVHADRFAIHLLGAHQADLAEHFAIADQSSAEQFARVPHVHPAPDRPPLLAGCFGVLHCRRWAVYDAGDHDLFLGRVLRVDEGEAEGPLLYYARSYRAVGDEV